MASMSVGNVARYIVEIKSQNMENLARQSSFEYRALDKGLIALSFVVDRARAA